MPYKREIQDEILDIMYPTMTKTEIKKDIRQKSQIAKIPIFKENPDIKPIHNICRQLSIDVYGARDKIGVKNYHILFSDANPKTGFAARAYINTIDKNVVIAFKGTDKSFKDIVNDFKMWNRQVPNQFKDAEKFYFDTINKLGSHVRNYDVIFTGHSLGGSLSQMMGAKYGNETVTFNAFGTAGIKNVVKNYTDNITNYGNPNDIVFSWRKDEHIGKTIRVKNDVQDAISAQTSLKYHEIENMGDINKLLDTKKIDDYKQVIEKYVEDNQSSGGGTVYVESYTRGDGTDVRSHTRSAPSK